MATNYRAPSDPYADINGWNPNQGWTGAQQNTWQQDPRATAAYAPGSIEAQMQEQDLGNWQSSQGSGLAMGPQLLSYLNEQQQAQQQGQANALSQANRRPHQGGILGGITPQSPMNATSTGRPQQGQGMLGGAPAMGQLQGGQGGQFAGFGWDSVAPVQQAMMGRLQPQMDQARQTEINRLKAQGIPENSAAWGSAMDTLNRSDVDARNQGLLAGLGEQNTLWNQNLQQANFGNQSNQQAFGQRLSEQQLASQNAANQANQAYQQGNLTIQQRQQAMAEQNNPYQQMMWLNSMQQGNPVFGNFTNAGLGGSTDYSQAGKDTYSGLLGNYNAETAANAAKIGGIGQLAGGIGSSLINSPNAGSNLVSNVGGLVGGIGDAAKTIGGWFSGD